MDIVNRNTERLVVVTKKAGPWVKMPRAFQYRVMSGDNALRDMESALDGTVNLTFHIVLFIHVGEYRDLNEHLFNRQFEDCSYRFVVFGDERDLGGIELFYTHSIAEFRTASLSEVEFVFVVKKTMLDIEELYVSKLLQERFFNLLNDTKEDQENLINIGRALSIEKDQNNLLRLILTLSKRITGADAGSIYLVEDDEEGKKRLRFKYSHTFSRNIPLEEFVMAMSKKSIAGYTAVTGEVLNIPDAYNLPEKAPYSFNSSFDKQNSYISRSMLVVPMKNHVDEIIGVIQLINSKENVDRKQELEDEAFTIRLEKESDFDKFVVTFNDKYNHLMEAVAGQAAIAIENNRMVQQIQRQFEEFVKASVTAIESRDPATSGHSFRVAEICKEMAYAVNGTRHGGLGDFQFTENDIRELEYAALLHDFGKVYIDLAVFKKAKKLYPKDLENLSLRLNYLYRFLELQYSFRESELLRRLAKDENTSSLMDLVKERKEKLGRIHEISENILSMNEPAMMSEDMEERLDRLCGEIDEIQCFAVNGNPMDVVPVDSRNNLKIKRGSLNQEERKEIESHVVHTYRFVSKIPWPPEYRRIPEIALRHHEKLDGTGYPDGLKGKESMLLQARIMAIADIYDALIASDRPYKKAMPLEKVISVLREEADRGVLDEELVEIFIENQVYEKVTRDSFKVIETNS